MQMDLTFVYFFLLQTKELLADLQDLLPNTEDAGGANLTMNTVLQCAIDFLTQHAGESSHHSLPATLSCSCQRANVEAHSHNNGRAIRSASGSLHICFECTSVENQSCI